MQTRRFFLLGTLLASSAGAAVACQIIAGIDDRSVYVPGASDSGAVPDGDLCRVANVPTAPDLSTSSSTDSLDFVTVLSELHLGVGPDAGGPYGFNLDRACTCPEKDTCVRGLGANGKQLGPACDDPGGIDNTGKPLFALFASGNLINEAMLNTSIRNGQSGVFLRVRYYNGLPDDAEVQVAVYSSLGYQGYPDASPKFDGTDPWKVERGSLVADDLNNPRYVTNSGYVRGGTLVATLKFPIIIGSSGLDPIVIELQSGLIAAKLELAGTSLVRMNGVLAGRWEASRMLTSLQAVADPLKPAERLCGPNTTYQAIKPKICEYVDIAADPTDDGTGVCNALSMGLGFESRPAQFGPIQSSPEAGTPCGPGYTDSCQ